MSGNLRNLLDEAEKLYEQSKWDEALELYRKVLEQDPNNEDACYKSAAIYSYRGLIPSVIEQYFKLMDIFENAGDLDQAVEVARWIQKIQPENDQARLRTILIYKKKNDTDAVVRQSMQLARLYIELGKGEESIMLLRSAQETSPDNLEIALELAEVYMSHGHINDAASHYRSVGTAYLQRNELEKAVEAFRRMKVIIADDPQLLLMLGNIYLILRRYNDAEIEYRAVLRLDLGNSEALMALGNVCQLKGQFRDAILAFSKILSIDPQEVRAKEKLGELYQAQGNHVEAIKNYLSASNIYQSIEETEKAVRLYQRVLALDPTNPTACRELTNLGAPLVGEEDDEILTPFRPHVPGLDDDYVYEPESQSQQQTMPLDSAPSSPSVSVDSPMASDFQPPSGVKEFGNQESAEIPLFGDVPFENEPIPVETEMVLSQPPKFESGVKDSSVRDKITKTRDKGSDGFDSRSISDSTRVRKDEDKQTTSLLIPKDQQGSSSSKLLPKGGAVGGRKGKSSKPVLSGDSQPEEEDAPKTPLLRSKSGSRKSKPTLSATPKKQLFARKSEMSDSIVENADKSVFSKGKSKSSEVDSSPAPQQNINDTSASQSALGDFPGFGEAQAPPAMEMPSFGGGDFPGFGEAQAPPAMDSSAFGGAFPAFGDTQAEIAAPFSGNDFPAFGGAPQTSLLDPSVFGSGNFPDTSQTDPSAAESVFSMDSNLGDPFSSAKDPFSSVAQPPEQNIFAQQPQLSADSEIPQASPFSFDSSPVAESSDSVFSSSVFTPEPPVVQDSVFDTPVVSEDSLLQGDTSGEPEQPPSADTLKSVGKDFGELPSPSASIQDSSGTAAADGFVYSGEVKNTNEDLSSSLSDKLNSGDLSSAIDIFNTLLETNPADRDRRLELAELYFNNGLIKESIEQYKILLEKEESNIDFLAKLMTISLWDRDISLAEETMLAIARIYMANNETLLALEYYQSVLAINPDNIEAREELIDIYSQQKIDKAALHHLNMIGQVSVDKISPDKALALLKKVYSLTNSEDVYVKLAAAYEKAGLADDAISAYKELLSRFRERNDLQKVCFALEKLKALIPDDVDIYQQLSVIYGELGDEEQLLANKFDLGKYFISRDNVDEAMTVFEEIVNLRPMYFEARENLINIYFDKELLDKAFEHIKILAAQYMDKSESAETVKLYMRFLSVSPDDISARKELISVYLDLGDKDNALGQMQLLAEKLSASQKWQEAVDTYYQIIDMDTEQKEARYKAASVLANHLSDTEKALAFYAENFEQDPFYTENTKAYVYLLLESGKPDDAMQVLSRLISMDESYAALRDEIVESYKTKVEESPENLSYRFHLGVMYKQLGRIDDAIEQFQKTKRDFGPTSLQLALCFSMKPGMRSIAIRTLVKALEENRGTDEEKKEMQYVLAGFYEESGKKKEALELYNELGTDYKDVAKKIEACQQ